MSFTKKIINATIVLENGAFVSTGPLASGASLSNTVTLNGLRIVANIDKAGGISPGHAYINIYGMKQSDMNLLTMLAFHPLNFPDNQISLSAGDDVSSTSLVYAGTITAAWADYSAAPETCLKMEAVSGFFAQLNPVPPISFKGATTVDSIMSQLAAKMGYAYKNNGVNITLASPYFPGTAMDQARACVKAADIEFYLDDTVLAIAPKGKAAFTEQVALINTDTGLIGYPTFDKMGIYFESFYNPAIRFGGLVEIKSIVQTANGQWRVVSLGHLLESEKPNGAWLSRVWVTDNDLTVSPA